MEALGGSSQRFQPIVLEPGAPGAYACFGRWENVRTCQPLEADPEDPLQGCSQAVECRRHTLERNPPTTRFTAKPRKDGRFEVQQFREFIGEQTTYQVDVQDGQIVVTYPGERNVPSSRRFFLHKKHVEEAGMDIDQPFDLIVSLERMVIRQAGASDDAGAGGPGSTRREEEDPEARRQRIAEHLRLKATEDARSREESEEDLDIELDAEVEVDEEVELEGGEANVEQPAPAEEPVAEGELDEDLEGPGEFEDLEGLGGLGGGAESSPEGTDSEEQDELEDKDAADEAEGEASEEQQEEEV